MIFSETKYEEEDYKGLIRELLVAPDLDAEFQFRHFKSVLIHNRRLFLLLFKALNEVKNRAILFEDETLQNAINRLEAKMYEYTNIIPANLPDSILSDRTLLGYLSDQSRIHFINDEWGKVKGYILEKYDTIPQKEKRPFLEWCMKMLQMHFERHKKKCTNPTDCPINQGYDLRIQFIKSMLEKTPGQSETLPGDSEPLQISDLHSQSISHNSGMSQTQDSGLRLSDRKGAKIDLIRIVNAMWELGFFKDKDGLKPTKLTTMKTVGTLFGIDLSEYNKDLSQAFQNTNAENNIKIFRELEEITKNKLI